jgi:hypothetical protein
LKLLAKWQTEESEEASRLHEAEVRQAAGFITRKPPSWDLRSGKGLAGISEQLTEQVKLPATVREAVLLEHGRLVVLDDLHPVPLLACMSSRVLKT